MLMALLRSRLGLALKNFFEPGDKGVMVMVTHRKISLKKVVCLYQFVALL